MTGNFPNEHARNLDEEGIPGLETPVNQDEGMIPPRDHPQGADEFGVTGAEERADETLDQRRRREQPDFDESSVADAADEAAGIGGRLIERGSEDVDAVDDEKDSVAELGDQEGTAMSAEESAMHITDRP